MTKLQGTSRNCGLVSRNRPVSTSFYKGTLVSFLVLDVKKVLYLEVCFLNTQNLKTLKALLLNRFKPLQDHTASSATKKVAVVVFFIKMRVSPSKWEFALLAIYPLHNLRMGQRGRQFSFWWKTLKLIGGSCSTLLSSLSAFMAVSSALLEEPTWKWTKSMSAFWTIPEVTQVWSHKLYSQSCLEHFSTTIGVSLN